MATIVIMFTPQDSKEMQLRNVNKSFYQAVKSVVPLQEQTIYEKLTSIQM